MIATLVVAIVLLTALSVAEYFQIKHWKAMYNTACDEGKTFYDETVNLEEQHKNTVSQMDYMKSTIGQLLSRPIIAVLNEKDANNLTVAVLSWLEAQKNPNKVN